MLTVNTATSKILPWSNYQQRKLTLERAAKVRTNPNKSFVTVEQVGKITGAPSDNALNNRYFNEIWSVRPSLRLSIEEEMAQNKAGAKQELHEVFIDGSVLHTQSIKFHLSVGGKYLVCAPAQSPEEEVAYLIVIGTKGVPAPAIILTKNRSKAIEVHATALEKFREFNFAGRTIHWLSEQSKFADEKSDSYPELPLICLGSFLELKYKEALGLDDSNF